MAKTFMVVTPDDREFECKADEMEVQPSGALVLTDKTGTVIAYSATSWKWVYPESD